MPAPELSNAPETEESSNARSGGARHGRGFECDACEKWFEGEPFGAGLFLWTRGDEVRYEEPPLCEGCASEITVGALMKWDAEDEEEG